MSILLTEKCGPYVTQEIEVVQIAKPVRVVDYKCAVVCKINNLAHLFLEALDVMVDSIKCQNLPHVRASGRVSDHSCAAAH